MSLWYSGSRGERATWPSAKNCRDEEEVVVLEATGGGWSLLNQTLS